MAGVNKVILIGNLGKDPEIRSLESGAKVASFTVATSETYKNKNGERVEQTEWHNVVFWGALVDVIEKYVRKGSKLYVEGKLRTRSYEKDGVTKYFTEVWGQNMTMLDSAGKSDSAPSYGGEKTQTSQAKSAPVAIEDEADDDLPF